jgi:hypothetical protein
MMTDTVRSSQVPMFHQVPGQHRVWSWFFIPVTAVGIFLLVLAAPNDLTNSDPQGCLLTAHALIHTGTLDLSPWPGLATPNDYRFRVTDGRIFYSLGFGTALLAAPAVWIAECAGLDITDPAGDRRLQRLMAAAIVSGLFLLGYRLFRLALVPVGALALSLSTTLGTAFASTLGTAMWNMGPAVLAITAAVFLVARHDRTNQGLRPILLGSLLGIAILVRPTSLLPVLFGLGYVALRARRDLPRLLLGLIPWLLLFLLVSRREYGTWLPDYYLAVGQEQRWSPLFVLRGQLISPGRGVLVFTPFFGPLLLWALIRNRRMSATLLGLGGAIWFAMHAASIVRHFHWWGGTCFGPRLSTDSVPALMLVALAVADDWQRLHDGVVRRLAAVGFSVLVIVAIWIHTAQGLYNPAAMEWNRSPSVELHYEGIFDWRWPQFLASEQRNVERNIDLGSTRLQPLGPGIPVPANSPLLAFTNWYEPEGGPTTGWWRWSRGGHSWLVIHVDAHEPTPRRLILRVGAYGRRTATVRWNGVLLETFTCEGFGPFELTFAVPPEASAATRLAGGRHLLEFELAGTSSLSTDPRDLGVHLMELHWE